MNEVAHTKYQRIFENSPDKSLLLKTGTFEIINATDEFLKATKSTRNEIIGKTIFEIFKHYKAHKTVKLRASLKRAEALNIPDYMGLEHNSQYYHIDNSKLPAYTALNIPVIDDQGKVEFIIHRIEDVTDLVQLSDNPKKEAFDSIDKEHFIKKLITQSKELSNCLSKIQEHEARMRTAERLLNLGTWEYELNTGHLNWSEQVFSIYGRSQIDAPPDIEEYFALVHPDDRESALAKYQDFLEKQHRQIEFEHRVICHKGETKYIRGVGERHLSTNGEVVIGFVQDITQILSTKQKLIQANELLQIAGEKAHLGGWRFDINTGTVTWTRETAIIHGMSYRNVPASIHEVFQFYTPEYREKIEKVLDLCTHQAKPFDIICRIQTPDGKQPWVRMIGIPDIDEQGKVLSVQGACQDITDLYQAQTHALEAEQQRINILESISDAFFGLDNNWNFTYVNQQAGILLERSPLELMGKNIWDEYPQTLESKFEEQFQFAIKSGQTTSFQEHYPPLSKWFDVTVYPIPNGLAVYFRDVTDDRQHQQQMRLIEAALSRLNDIVLITTASELNEPHGPKIVYVNDAFERLTGYTKNEAIGSTPRILQGPDTDRRKLDAIRDALESEEPIRCEVLNYDKSGSSYWLELDIAPLLDADGRCTHFVAVERDITQRKHQDIELQQAQERFLMISKATNDVIWDWDITNDKVWWNDSITRTFGYPISELEPGIESWTNHVHPDDLEDVLQSIHEVIDGDDEYWHEEYRFIKNDGTVSKVVDRGFLSRDESGNATRMVGTMLDVTEMMAMEQRLRESQKLEAIGHLTGGVAHDFNNLLTVILGNAEMLAETINDPDLQSMADMMVTAAERGADLTNRLLAFASRQPLAPKMTDVNQLIHSIHSLFLRTLPENIQLEFIPSPRLGIIEVDHSELQTALLNLVVNARDAMPEGGSLIIETSNASLDNEYADHHYDVVAGDYVMISVSDTGTGMTPEILQHVFEPFFTTKEVGKGSGLGLSMVFGFTKQSGGHIRINSEIDEGTTIKLFFPVVREDLRNMDMSETAQQQSEGGSEHILIAEDDELVLKNLKNQLKSLGYKVTAVTTGPEALEVLESPNDIALLLTDVIMPGGMSGRDLADAALKIIPSLKVLFSSGYTQDAIVHHGRLDQDVSLLSKPYTYSELASKIREVLKN